MKKTVLFILAILLLITSCNMDATTGIFQSVMDSTTTVTEPITQIMNITDSSIFFVSSKGIFKFDDSGYTCIVSNTEAPRISKGIYVSDELIYFTNSDGSINGSEIKYYKYTTAGGVEPLSNTMGLDSDDIIIGIVNSDQIFVYNKGNRTITVKGIDVNNNKFTEGTILSTITVPSTAEYKFVGVEMYGNFISISYSNKDEKDYYRFKNYVLNSDFTTATEVTGISDTIKLTGAYANTDGWVATGFNNTDTKKVVTLYKINSDGTINGDAVPTDINSSDRDIAIGLKDGKYFFHIAGNKQVHHINQELTNLGTTSFNNFSSKLDFVSIYNTAADGTGDALIPTSQNGVYRLTDLSSANGFNRINSL